VPRHCLHLEQTMCDLSATEVIRHQVVRFPAGVGNFFLHHRVQIGSGAHLASYPMGTGGFFPGGEADGV
jgi:hypothetical protein